MCDLWVFCIYDDLGAYFLSKRVRYVCAQKGRNFYGYFVYMMYMESDDIV